MIRSVKASDFYVKLLSLIISKLHFIFKTLLKKFCKLKTNLYLCNVK